MNGGVCIAPGVCQCLKGFHGETCQEGKAKKVFRNTGCLMTTMADKSTIFNVELTEMCLCSSVQVTV